MMLCEIPKGSIINAITSDDKGHIGTQIKFHRLDGAYSYCTIVGDGRPCHLSGAQELKIEGDGTYSLSK